MSVRRLAAGETCLTARCTHTHTRVRRNRYHVFVALIGVRLHVGEFIDDPGVHTSVCARAAGRALTHMSRVCKTHVLSSASATSHVYGQSRGCPCVTSGDIAM